MEFFFTFIYVLNQNIQWRRLHVLRAKIYISHASTNRYSRTVVILYYVDLDKNLHIFTKYLKFYYIDVKRLFTALMYTNQTKIQFQVEHTIKYAYITLSHTSASYDLHSQAFALFRQVYRFDSSIREASMILICSTEYSTVTQINQKCWMRDKSLISFREHYIILQV